jgi:hypothetical protein
MLVRGLGSGGSAPRRRSLLRFATRSLPRRPPGYVLPQPYGGPRHCVFQDKDERVTGWSPDGVVPDEVVPDGGWSLTGWSPEGWSLE